MAFSQISQREPIGNKSVKQLAGIGGTLAKNLKKKGYKKAYNVLGKFLVLNKNEKLFKDWLMETVDATSEQSQECYQCLKIQCDNFL